ncbi:MAG: 2-hydroxychromene-2-carboxylate isomerase [Sphingomonadales bacterium]|nr:2-hydroxychromene-2-carboxylate isomerase [Sphingomonadales bacterium]
MTDKICTMNTSIRRSWFYFDYISPFGWIAAERIGELAARHGRSVTWRPILLKATVVEAMGLPPLLDTPLKGPYLLHDAKRQARLYGLRLHKGARVYFRLVAARATVWARRFAPDAVEPLILALYRCRMQDGADISTPQSVVAIAAKAGIDADALAVALDDPAVKAELKSDIDDAIRQGIFGSPTLVIDGEAFWGSDRIDQAMSWMVGGGW